MEELSRSLDVPERLREARAAIPNYLNAAHRRPGLSSEDEMELIRDLQDHESGAYWEARELLFYQYVNLIRVLAYRFVRHYPPEMLDVRDLIQDSVVELLCKLDRHEPDFGLISTFIVRQIRGRVERAAHLYTDTVRLPERKRNKVGYLTEGRWRLAAQLKRAPSWEEVAAFLEWPLDDVHRVRGWARASDSVRFDGPQVRERPTFEHGTVPASPEVYAQLSEFREYLTPREDEVLIRMELYGESSDEIAVDFGLTGARIRQIRRGVTTKLRRVSEF